MSGLLSEIWPEAAAPEEHSTGPLRGVRVLDLTSVVMGPSATQILGDLGADVVKVESAAGDSMRWIGPFRHEGMGPLFLQGNRNKRSVVLNLKDPADRAALLDLVPRADVFVFNVRPQAMARLGLGYEAIRAVNPGILYVGAVGYGSDGPGAGKAVYDDLIQAASGIAGVFGTVDGTPRYAPVNICDRVVGLYLTIAITSALLHRERTGEGQQIEVPMFETMAQFVLADHMGGGAFAPPAGPMGYRRLLSRFRGPYPTADGHLSIVVYTDRHWRAFSAMLGIPELMDTDPRFRSQESRTVHAEHMGQFLAERLPSRTTAEWIALLEAADIPCCAVNSLEMLREDPHLRAVELFQEVEHPTEGTLTTTRFPVRFDRTPADIRRLAPNLGEHGGHPTRPETTPQEEPSA
ncbi:CaiB/BaiF CoA transferase family protein [Roseomonas sp. BN140053]|uniref:CaiB/BaiF CoA transferase family protein n=1 Tax=Roseomonas sp. BN140053 TaxID=3391898 RepID=UPI0039EC1AEF